MDVSVASWCVGTNEYRLIVCDQLDFNLLACLYENIRVTSIWHNIPTISIYKTIIQLSLTQRYSHYMASFRLLLLLWVFSCFSLFKWHTHKSMVEIKRT